MKVNQRNRLRLWLQWITANAIGELLGLGTVGVIGFLLASKFEESVGWVSAISFPLLMIILGAFEGAVLGLAQWLVLRKIINRLSRRSWVFASLTGAVMAWALGMLLSTIMNLTSQNESRSPDFSEIQIMLVASAMGIILGIILALPQWIVLRKYVERASWWLGANSVAWAFGMPLIFLVAGTVPEGEAAFQVMAKMLLTIAAAGGIVGAIHGLVLVWIVRPKQSLGVRDYSAVKRRSRL